MIIRNLVKMSFAQRSLAAIRQHEQAKKRRRAIFGIKFANIAVYAGVFLLVISMIYIGYDQPQKTTAVNNVVTTSSVSSSEQPSVADAVAANVAAGVAQTINLPVAASVSSLAISVETMSSTINTETSSAVKPKIIESVVESRLVQSYTVVAGDTVSSLSKKFGITTQTIKWANDLTSDDLTAGDVLKILPIDGVLYTVKTTDTIASIADKYKVDSTRFVTYNDLEVSGLVANNNIILPDGTLPETERPGYVAPVTYSYYASGTGFGGSTWFMSYGTGACPSYAYGNCTCYAYFRRTQLGLGVGANWGNANAWAANAARDGYVVDQTPSVGAIMQSGGGWYGHVAIVESIAENGDVTISEMNASVSGGGYNIVSGRTVLAGNASQYNYIH